MQFNDDTIQLRGSFKAWVKKNVKNGHFREVRDILRSEIMNHELNNLITDLEHENSEYVKLQTRKEQLMSLLKSNNIIDKHFALHTIDSVVRVNKVAIERIIKIKFS